MNQKAIEKAVGVPAGTYDEGSLPSAREIDEIGVSRFTRIMRAKLAKKRRQGKGGWWDPDACSTEHLQRLLAEHVAKGDPVDVANIAMMLYCRGETTS